MKTVHKTRARWWELQITLSIVAGIVSCSEVYASQRAIVIQDIVAIHKVGAVSVSPDGQRVAYLVIQANIERDAYLIRLVVTSAGETGTHDEITRVEAPAVSSPLSSLTEDIGSNLTGGIVFTWDRGGRTLVYGVPDHGGTDLFEYSVRTRATRPLGKIGGEMERMVAIGDQKLGYCIDRPPSRIVAGNRLSDPAYRYDGTTFRFSDKHPWQDGRGFESGQRPPLELDSSVDCFEQDQGTRVITPVPVSSVRLYDPLRMKYSTTEGSYLGAEHITSRKYEGNPVLYGRESPDGRYILFAAAVVEPETVAKGRKTVFYVEEVGGDHTQKRLFEMVGTQEGEIGWFVWAADSKALLCFRESLDDTKLTRLDVSTGNETIVLETKWGIFHPTLSPDGRYLYATRQKPDVPAQLCRLDLVTGEMLLIDNVNPQFAEVSTPTYVSVRQSNEYGDELLGYLFLPPGFHGQSRLPFVAIKGQPWNGFCDGGSGDEFPGMVMATKGFAVLFFYPSTKHFYDSQEGNAAYSLLRFKSPIESLTLVIADLSKKGIIDQKKTGIAGLSMGADVVDYASGFSTVFSAGAATTGEVEAPANYFILGADVTALFAKRFGLPFPDVAGLPAWQAVSASLNASRSTMPLLFQPPDSEAWMTIPQHVAWDHEGLPVETYVYPDEGHVKVHPLNRYYVMTRNVQWFDFWLRGVEDSRSEFADQFRKWEKMREDWKGKQATRESAPATSSSSH